MKQDLKFKDEDSVYDFVAWGFKNGKIVIHVSHGRDRHLADSPESRARAYKLEYDR